MGGTAKHAFAPTGAEAFFDESKGRHCHEEIRALSANDVADRQWPSRRLEKAPIWCSVDLRDGNQALVEPMNVEEKLEMFKMLVRMGFKEIEVGFPSASQTEFDCVRTLIEQNLIPDDVTIQVLTQAREHLIRKTFEAVEGAKHVIMHLYTNISPMFQKCVYKTTRKGIVDIAVREIELLRMLAEMREDGGEGITFEYSPECFSEAEPRLAMVVLSSVIEHFGATPEKKLILNLPSTVEKTTPNEFADRIEYVDRFLPGRENVILSVHPHNDRGTGIAAAEMALLAGPSAWRERSLATASAPATSILSRWG